MDLNDLEKLQNHFEVIVDETRDLKDKYVYDNKIDLSTNPLVNYYSASCSAHVIKELIRLFKLTGTIR